MLLVPAPMEKGNAVSGRDERDPLRVALDDPGRDLHHPVDPAGGLHQRRRRDDGEDDRDRGRRRSTGWLAEDEDQDGDADAAPQPDARRRRRGCP